jgi:hypothetical protein
MVTLAALEPTEMNPRVAAVAAARGPLVLPGVRLARALEVTASKELR